MARSSHDSCLSLPYARFAVEGVEVIVVVLAGRLAVFIYGNAVRFHLEMLERRECKLRCGKSMIVGRRVVAEGPFPTKGSEAQLTILRAYVTLSISTFHTLESLFCWSPSSWMNVIWDAVPVPQKASSFGPGNLGNGGAMATRMT